MTLIIIIVTERHAIRAWLAKVFAPQPRIVDAESFEVSS